MRVQRLVICIDYDECDPLVYKCNTQSVILIDIQNNGRMTGVMPVNVCGCFFKQLVNRKSVTGAAFKKYLDLML